MRCLLIFLLMLTFFTTSTISVTTTKMTKICKNKTGEGKGHTRSRHVPGRRYVFFYWFHTHISSIKSTFIKCKYSSSLSLVAHSLIQMLIQVISHTYITLEPQASLVAYELVEFEVDLLEERVSLELTCPDRKVPVVCLRDFPRIDLESENQTFLRTSIGSSISRRSDTFHLVFFFE